MADLREKIAAELTANMHRSIALRAADRILAIPEIRDALAMLEEERLQPTKISIFDLARMAGVPEEKINPPEKPQP